MSRHQLPLAVRAHPIVLGMAIFIASETMFFSALFATYYNLKARAAVWPPPGVHLDLVGPSFGTAFLVFSSLTMFPMLRALEQRKFNAAYGWLYAAIVGGLAYIGDAMHGYSEQSFNMHSNAYASIYLTITGFHLLHVVAGVLMLLALYFGLRSAAFRSDRLNGAEAISYYWHFVTIMWFGIFSTVYIIK
jgi:cytochrome c oxidase subunit III